MNPQTARSNRRTARVGVLVVLAVLAGGVLRIGTKPGRVTSRVVAQTSTGSALLDLFPQALRTNFETRFTPPSTVPDPDIANVPGLTLDPGPLSPIRSVQPFAEIVDALEPASPDLFVAYFTDNHEFSQLATVRRVAPDRYTWVDAITPVIDSWLGPKAWDFDATVPGQEFSIDADGGARHHRTLFVGFNPATQRYELIGPPLDATDGNIPVIFDGLPMDVDGDGRAEIVSDTAENNGTYRVFRLDGTELPSTTALPPDAIACCTKADIANADPCAVCILGPSGQVATLTGNAKLITTGHVFVNGSGPNALSLTGNAAASASSGKVSVAGQVRLTGNAVLTPQPVTGQPQHTDLFAYIPLPPPMGAVNSPTCTITATTASCTGGVVPTNGSTVSIPDGNYTSLSVSSRSASIGPGAYGQITATGASTLTLRPGVYVFNGAGLNVSGSAQITGTGVVLALTCQQACNGPGAAISVSGSASLNLTTENLSSAAGAGVYASSVIVADRTNTASITLSGTALLRADGNIYLKSGSVSLSGSARLDHIGSTLVASSLALTGNGKVQSLPA